MVEKRGNPERDERLADRAVQAVERGDYVLPEALRMDSDGLLATVPEYPSPGTNPRGHGKRRNLTAKQEKFVHCIARGMSQSDAYRAAYDAGGMKPAVINHTASQLAANPLVSERLQAIREAQDRLIISSAGNLRSWVLSRLQHEAIAAGSDAARIRALELLGKIPEVDLFGSAPENALDGKDQAALKRILREKLDRLKAKQSPRFSDDTGLLPGDTIIDVIPASEPPPVSPAVTLHDTDVE